MIVLTLAVGIGSSTAIFTYFNWEYWHEVRAPDPDRLFFVLGGTRENPPGGASAYLWGGMSYQDALAYRDALAEVGDLSLWTLYGAAVGLPGDGGGAGRTIYRLGAAVSPRHFESFGVRFALGSGFRPEENRPAGPRVAVVDYTFWRRYLGGDPAVVGRTIRLNSVPFTIVGVTPRGFQNVAVPFPIYVPTARIDEIGTRPRLTDRNARSFSGFLRLPDGSPEREAVEARLAAVAANLDREHPLPEDQKRQIAVRGVEGSVESPAPGVLMLAAAVGLLLLLACANVANLLLARAAGRRREIAMLAVIGAGPLRIAARLLTESGLLAIVGGALGFGLARWLITVIKNLGWTYPVGFGSWAEGIEWMEFDGRVLFFTLLVSVMTAALFALAPVLHAARTDLVSALKGTTSPTKSGRRFSARQGLVVTQVALATLLLLGAGLLVRSLWELRHTELGFETEHQLLAVMAGAPPRTAATGRAEEREVKRRLYELGRQRLAALPGVGTVTLASSILGSGVGRARLVLPERPDESFQVDRITIGPDFFETFGIALDRGRGFHAGDRAGGIGAAIVNRAFVERFWGGGGAVGRELRLPDLGADTDGDRFVVVGVAADVRHASPRQAPAPFVYLSLRQHFEGRLAARAATVVDLPVCRGA